MRKMKAQSKPEPKSLREGIARALWAAYEYGLPDTPGRMSASVMGWLEHHGYIDENGERE